MFSRGRGAPDQHQNRWLVNGSVFKHVSTKFILIADNNKNLTAVSGWIIELGAGEPRATRRAADN